MALTFNNMKQFWEKRIENRQGLAVGHSATSAIEQDQDYKSKIDFTIENLDTSLRVLDFGCGIGRYAKLFDKDKYLGLDFSGKLIEIAERDNEEYSFQSIDPPIVPEDLHFDFDMFFTATVLQHNCDDSVIEIFKSLKRVKDKKLIVTLYENSQDSPNLVHVAYRTTEDYEKLLNIVFDDVKLVSKETHTARREEHTLSTFYINE